MPSSGHWQVLVDVDEIELDSYGHGGPSRSRLDLVQACTRMLASTRMQASRTLRSGSTSGPLRLSPGLGAAPSRTRRRGPLGRVAFEQLLDDIGREPILDAPRLDRALAYRATLELRALGREVLVPPLGCLTAG